MTNAQSRMFRFNVPTVTGLHLRDGSIVNALGGTWLNVTFDALDAHGITWFTLLLTNSTGTVVAENSNSNPFNLPMPTVMYVLDRPGTYRLQLNTGSSQYTEYDVTLSYTDAVTGLPRTETHHGYVGSWGSVTDRYYYINASAPAVRPFGYDYAIPAKTGDVLTAQLTVLSYYQNNFVDTRIIDNYSFIEETQVKHCSQDSGNIAN